MTVELRRLIEDFIEKKLTRREFILRSLALGLSVGAIESILTACGSASPMTGTITGTSTSSAVANLSPTVSATPTEPPSPYKTARDYLKAWSEGRYADMYALLSTESKVTITQDKFVSRYQAIKDMATITSIQAQVKPGADKASAVIPFTVAMTTTEVGPINEENSMQLVQEGQDWKVRWETRLIFKNLWGDSLVHLYPYSPERGAIYDRNGKPIAAQDQQYTVGVVPGQIKDEAALLATLSEILKLDQQTIKDRYTKNAQPDWFMPVADLPLNTPQDVVDRLEAIDGVLTQRKPVRVYPNGTLAAHVVGYIGQVTADDLKGLSQKGYKESDSIGKAGLEHWGEQYLAGQRGAKLAIVSPEGTIQSTIAERPGKASQDIYTTIDLAVQKAAEDALGDKRGAVVVLNPKDGSVLAMASHPTYDPNAFIGGISSADWAKLSQDPGTPMNNKAIGSTYPSGSIFKVVTMGAGMEKAGFNKDSSFHCAGRWNGLGGAQTWTCWNLAGHGNINLFQGLVQSCDVVFYELGKKEDSIDPELLPSFAEQYGLGQPTGLIGLPEETGVVPDPKWKESVIGEPWYSGDSVNFSIGQGYFLATPLQMTNIYNAIAANGSLYRPFIVERIQTPDGEVVLANQSEVKAKLPVSPDNLNVIKEALKKVTVGPVGTAWGAFNGYPIPIAGKTGTAEQGGGKPAHAWFMSYGPADDPQFTVGVIVEEGGEGSTVSAPIARKVFEAILK